MEIVYTPLYREAISIIENGDTGSNISWSAIIHMPGINRTYVPLQVVAINILSDFIKGYTDELTCTLMIPLGKYARLIYPNRTNLEITLTKTPLKESSQEVKYNTDLESERYSAILIDGDKSPTVGQGRETNDEDALDLMDMLPVSFQLTNKSIEKIRMISVGGIFRNTTVKDTILAILTKESQSVKVNNKRVLDGVDIVDPKNTAKRDHILLPQGIKLFDVCDYIQKNIGVYNAAIGSYIRGSTWYVFPLYDNTRFNQTKLTLSLLILPKNKFPQLERTYKKKGNSLTVLITSDTGFKDDSGTQYLNYGNGSRFADANKFMEGFSQTVNNATLVSRAKNNNEFKLEDRPNKANLINVTENKITANPFYEYSKIVARNGGVFKTIWENSNPSLLVPGMVTRISYFDDGQVKEIFATLLAAEHSSMRMGDFGSSRHVVNSLLHFFVNQKKES
jgi:hypothetical protein